MKTIIAPTDFSDVSANAVNYAADMAVYLNAQLMLMHVNEFIYAYSEAGAIEGLLEEHSDNKLQELEAKLMLRTNNKLLLKKHLVNGNLEEELHSVCNVLKPFAVVMGTHDEFSAINRFFLSSRSLHAAKSLHCPVIIIPHNTVYKKIDSIGFACDLKNIYEIPAEQIKTIQEDFHAALHVVHISKNKMQKNTRAVESLLLQHELMFYNTEMHIVEDENVAKGLEKFVTENNVDLMMIQAKDYGTIGNMFHKSQSRQMILHPKMPLMIVH